jgi:predicted kinase
LIPMSGSEGPRSVKIGADERTGWSSERPRRTGGPDRPPDISVRCKVLRPSEALRYSPGSLLVITSASEADREALANRVVEQKGALLSTGKVRELLAGRVPDEEMEARAAELLDAAASKRLGANESTVVVASALDPAERERLARLAAAAKRPRHLILVETARENVSEDDLAPLNELRRRLDAGELGAEGFDTALRLGGDSIGELKRIVFRPPPRDD